MGITSAVSEAVEAISIWLNPERREKVILREAIESAEELLKIFRRQGRYANFSEKQLKEYEVHYQKRFDAWKDGQT